MGAPLPMIAPATPALQVEGLTLNYGALPVLAGLDLSIASGEFVALLGPSGCGKSTLLRALAGLVAPTAGRVHRGPGDGFQPGLMFQKPLLLPWRTTRENVLLPVEIARGSGHGPADRARADQLLALVHLTEFADRYPHELSGGMQQRVALARALMADPEVLLLDEPFGALDELTREVLNEELLRIWAARATRLRTLVMVTHSIAEALALADRVLVFGPRPTGLAAALDVPVPRPRSLAQPAVAALAQRVRELLRGSP